MKVSILIVKDCSMRMLCSSKVVVVSRITFLTAAAVDEQGSDDDGKYDADDNANEHLVVVLFT